MKIKIFTLMAFFASVILIGPVGSARAADEWFVLSQKALDPANPSVEIGSEGGRWEKDVKQIKFSVEGRDVQVMQAVLHWDNRPDEIILIGLLQVGRETVPSRAPGRKARLKSVTLQCNVLGEAPATLKLWGYD